MNIFYQDSSDSEEEKPEEEPQKAEEKSVKSVKSKKMRNPAPAEGAATKKARKPKLKESLVEKAMPKTTKRGQKSEAEKEDAPTPVLRKNRKRKKENDQEEEEEEQIVDQQHDREWAAAAGGEEDEEDEKEGNHQFEDMSMNENRRLSRDKRTEKGRLRPTKVCASLRTITYDFANKSWIAHAERLPMANLRLNGVDIDERFETAEAGTVFARLSVNSFLKTYKTDGHDPAIPVVLFTKNGMLNKRHINWFINAILLITKDLGVPFNDVSMVPLSRNFKRMNALVVKQVHVSKMIQIEMGEDGVTFSPAKGELEERSKVGVSDVDPPILTRLNMMLDKHPVGSADEPPAAQVFGNFVNCTGAQVLGMEHSWVPVTENVASKLMHRVLSADDIPEVKEDDVAHACVPVWYFPLIIYYMNREKQERVALAMAVSHQMMRLMRENEEFCARAATGAMERLMIVQEIITGFQTRDIRVLNEMLTSSALVSSADVSFLKSVITEQGAKIRTLQDGVESFMEAVLDLKKKETENRTDLKNVMMEMKFTRP